MGVHALPAAAGGAGARQHSTHLPVADHPLAVCSMGAQASRPSGGPTPLFQAILAGDHARLRSLLAAASPADLAVGPVSLWHAAAFAGDATAVRLLAAAGAPIAAADRLADLQAQPFHGLLTEQQQRMMRRWADMRSAVATCVAAACGHAHAVAALLAAGASPHALGSLTTAPSWNPECFEAVRLLLEDGADVQQCSLFDLLQAARSSCRLGRLLLRSLHRELAAGRYALPSQPKGMQRLLQAAAVADCPALLERFAAAMPPPALSPEAASCLFFNSIAAPGSVQLLQWVVQAEAGGPAAAAYPTIAAWLVPAFEAAGCSLSGPDMLGAAAAANQPAVIRLLVAAGFVVMSKHVAIAIDCFSSAALEALLADGPPDTPAALSIHSTPENPLRCAQPSQHLSSILFSPPREYSECPVLAAFIRRRMEVHTVRVLGCI